MYPQSLIICLKSLKDPSRQADELAGPMNMSPLLTGWQESSQPLGSLLFAILSVNSR